MINFQNSPLGFVKNIYSLLVKWFDIFSKSTLFLLLSNYACYVYLTKCGVLKSSTFIFLLMLSTLARVFTLCIVKTFHLMDKDSCNHIFIEVDNYYQIKINYFPTNAFYPAFCVIEWQCQFLFLSLFFFFLFRDPIRDTTLHSVVISHWSPPFYDSFLIFPCFSCQHFWRVLFWYFVEYPSI